MQRVPVLSKILPLVVIASLLSLPLVCIMKNSFLTSYEDAIFEASFMVNEDGNNENCFLQVNPELSFNVDLIAVGELRLPGDRLESSLNSALAILSPKEIISEIYIPPKNVS